MHISRAFGVACRFTCIRCLVHAGEALRSLDGLDEFLSELLVGLVGRQVEPVEAGVSTRVVGRAAPLLYSEQLRTVGAV